MNATPRTTNLDLNAEVIGSGRYFLAFSLLFIALIIIYANSFHAEFHYDDFPNIVRNPNLRMETLSWGSVKASISDVRAFDKIKRPLPYLTFALNYFFHRTDVFGYHVVNFSIHFLTAIFLFLFTKNMLELSSASPFFRNYSYPIALLSSFLWSTHPIQVTAVTYIVQRMASMAGMFYILSMFFYLKARTSPIRWQTAVWALICVLTGLCAVGSKENAAILPLSLLLFDYIFFHNQWTEINRKKALIAAFSTLLVGFIASQLVNPFSILEGYQSRPFTLSERLLTQPRVIVLYLWLLIYPVSANFTLIHDVSVSTDLFSPWTTFPAIIVITGLLVTVFWLKKRWPVLSFSILFFFLNHVVESSVLPLELIYEHRNYIPSFFFFVPIAVAICGSLTYFYLENRKVFFLLLSVAIIVISTQAHTTHLYNAIFKTESSLWQDTYVKSPERNLSKINYATTLFLKGKVDQALQLLKDVVDSQIPSANLRTDAIPYYNLAQHHLYFSGECDKALALLKKSTEYRELTKAIHDISKIKYLLGDLSAAREYLNNAITVSSYESASLKRTKALIFLREGKVNQAINMSLQATQIDRNFSPPYYILGESYRIKGRLEKAKRFFERYLSMEPTSGECMIALIEIYDLTGQEALKNRLVFRLLSVKASEKDLVRSFKDYNRQANFLGCSRTTDIFKIVIKALKRYHTNISIHSTGLCTSRNVMDGKSSDPPGMQNPPILLPTRLLHDK